MELRDIGNIKFYSSDLDEDITIKEYLKRLLLTLWEEGEGFSGKRPFGNSGWDYDLYAVLINNNVIDGKLDEEGYIDSVDHNTGNKIIKDLIRGL